MVWFLSHNCSSSQYYNNVEIPQSSGIYYEQLETVQFYETSWDIVTYLELSTFEEKLTYLDNIYSKTKQLCQHKFLNEISFCNNHKILDQLIPSIYNQEKTLKTLIGNHRQKRALLNIVGSLFKSVFGTLDEADAEFYNDAINKVNQNENHLVDLIKQQVQVVKSTITNFNNTIVSLNNNKITFNENLSKLSKYIEGINKKYFDLELKQTIGNHFSLINLMLSELETEYETIINSILFAKSNILHPFVMTPLQLIEELKKTLPYLNNAVSYTLPLEPNNAFKLSEYVNIKVYANNNRIIYVISNPLTSITKFNMYNLIPLPLTRNNNLVFILPSFNYLALSEDKNIYTILKNRDACKSTSKNKLICKTTQPFFNTHIRPICETKLLLSIDYIPSDCDARLVKSAGEIWHKLESSNSWLYVLPKITDVTLSCISHPTINLMLNKTGLLTVDKNCKVFTSSTTLISDNTNLEGTYKAIVPSFEIKIENCCEDDDKNKLNETLLHLSPLQAINLDKDSLNIASHKLNHIDELADELSKTTMSWKSVVTNSYFTYFFLTILKLFLIYLVYRIYKKCLKPRCSNSDSSCQKITNTLTFNLCKRSNKADLSVDLDDITCDSNSSPNESSVLRRSSRIAKLKDKI